MLDLSKYDEEFKAKLAEQLSVYVTIGSKIENPMWFQYCWVDEEAESLYFRSSQVNHIYFHLPLKNEDKRVYFDYTKTYEHFRNLKYSYIKEFWPTVYYEVRRNEKPEIKEPEQIQVKISEVKEVEINDYEKQANDFLKATNTTLKTSFKLHGVYGAFSDNTQRDIYTIVLKNDKHKFRFNFGQSIINTGIHPTTYDVLCCLTKYDVGTFQNFCEEFGYDTDSRKAYKIYKAVLREWKNIELLFTSEQIEQLQEIR